MTTMTIATRTPAHPYRIVLTSPLAHGAGNAGNTRLLRTQDVIMPDGERARVPFLSGASIRNGLRSALAWEIASLLVLEGKLTKAAVDLLWSGGAVTSTGAQVDLDLQRRIDQLVPGLGMMGYAARSDIHEGVLRASDAILVCAENAWRLDPDTAALRTGRAAAYRTEEFGTRHDAASSMAARMIAPPDTLTDTDSVSTVQMIFDTQVLAAGAMLSGSLDLTPAATEAHRHALGAAVALWAPGGEVHLGASTATGYGAGIVKWLDGWDEGERADDLAWLRDHVNDHGDEIVDLISEASK